MLRWLSDLPAPLLFAAMVALGVGLTLALDVLVRRRVPAEARHSATQTAAVMLQVTATLYAILIGFVVVDEYTQLRNVQAQVSEKAGALASVFENSRGLDEPAGHNVRVATMTYAQAFVDHTFPSLEHHQAPATATAEALGKLLVAVHAVAPASPEQVTAYDAVVRSTNDAITIGQRIVGADTSTVPNAMVWLLVLIGVVVMATATALDTQHRTSHLLILSSMAMVIWLTLALVISMDYPYGGVVRVGAGPLVGFIRTHVP
jgi:Protein of unknown function (DUF4239)